MPQDAFLTSTILTDWGIWLVCLGGVVLLGFAILSTWNLLSPLL